MDDLVVRARDGDREAFAELVHATSDRMYAIATRILRDADLAEDALQSALVSAWRQLPTLRDPARFEAWLRRVLVHACYAEARRRPRWAADDVIQQANVLRAPDAYHEVIDRDALERGFQRLTLDHRAVIVLRYLLDMTPEEVADTLGIPRKTVYSRLDRAVRAMRGAMEADARAFAPTPGQREVVS